MQSQKYPLLAFRAQHETEQLVNDAHRAFVEQYESKIDLTDYRGNEYSRSRFLEDLVRVSLGLTTTNEDTEPFAIEVIQGSLAQTTKNIKRFEKVVEFLTEHSKKILQAA